MKPKPTAALAAMWLIPSEAVRLLFHRIAVDQALPLEPRRVGYARQFLKDWQRLSRSGRSGVPRSVSWPLASS